jgi:hypothetical protein
MAKFVRERWWDRAKVLACALPVALLGAARPLQGQAVAPPPPWRFSAEAGAIGGGVWLEGPRVPRVSTGVGFLFAAAARRALSDVAGVGAAFRASMQPLGLQENGVGWKGGTVTEYDLLALLTIRARSAAASRVSLEAGLGAALLTGVTDVVPFRDAPRAAPMGEAGLAVLLGNASSWRQDVSLVARYSVVRMSAEAADGGTTGWVGRATVGARITR